MLSVSRNIKMVIVEGRVSVQDRSRSRSILFHIKLLNGLFNK